MIDRVRNPSAPISPKELEDAAKRAAREAALEHARLGLPVCSLENGKVRWFSPAETLARHERPAIVDQSNS